MSELLVRHKILVGDIGNLLELHGRLAETEFGYNEKFEAYVAGGISDFVLDHKDCNRIWFVYDGDEFVGSIAICQTEDDIAQMRWLIVHPDYRMHGVASDLIEKALDFAKEQGYSEVFLLTEDSLEEAGRLYDKFGFKNTVFKEKVLFGKKCVEQIFVLRFD